MSESTCWAEIHRLDGQLREVRGALTDRLAGFDLALLLLSAASDRPAIKARLLELRKEMVAVEKERVALVADREALQKATADANADIERRREAVLAREIEVRGREDGLRIREASRGAGPDPYPHDPNFNPGTRSHTGLARERHHG
jgi:hypothetical protein